jgi:hypothetical protein
MELIDNSVLEVTYIENTFKLDSGVIVRHIKILHGEELISERIVNQQDYSLDSDLEFNLVEKIKEFSKNL